MSCVSIEYDFNLHQREEIDLLNKYELHISIADRLLCFLILSNYRLLAEFAQI